MTVSGAGTSGPVTSGAGGAEADTNTGTLTHRWSHGHTVVLAALTGIGVVMAFFLSRFTIDDAFITWRYGQTLVHHGTWTWDAWAPRVEAYTNPIYAFLSIIPALMGMSPELFFKIFSLLLATAFTTWIVAQREVLPWQRLTAVALTIANPVFQLHLWSGLETPLYVVTLVVAFGAITLHGRLGRIGLAAVIVLALTRPEGIAFAGLAVGWHWLIRRDRRSLLIAVGVVAGIVLYWTVRALYFGRFFPNTFYVKSTGGSRTEKLITLAYNLGVLALVLAAIVALALALRSWTAGDGTVRFSRRAVLTVPTEVLARWTPVLLATGATAVAVVLNRSSNLLMNYANRFEFQLVAPVVITILLTPLATRSGASRTSAVAPLALAGAVTVAGMVTVTSRPTQGLLLVAVAGLGVAVLWATRRPAAQTFVAITMALACSLTSVGGIISLTVYRPRLDISHHALATVLRESPVTNRTLVVGDAGIIPLVSDWHAIDQYGLANTAVTDGTFTKESLERQDPSVIIVNGGPAAKQSTSSSVDGTNTALQVALDPENGFTYLGGVSFRNNYSLQVYVNEDVDPTTRQRIRDLIERSKQRNAVSDIHFLATHRWDIPFLRGLV